MRTGDQVPENQYRCEFCGRWFDAEGELKAHEAECRGAFQSGREKPKAGPEKDLGEDRDWQPTP
jgi:hypothetical protein